MAVAAPKQRVGRCNRPARSGASGSTVRRSRPTEPQSRRLLFGDDADGQRSRLPLLESLCADKARAGRHRATTFAWRRGWWESRGQVVNGTTVGCQPTCSRRDIDTHIQTYIPHTPPGKPPTSVPHPARNLEPKLSTYVFGATSHTRITTSDARVWFQQQEKNSSTVRELKTERSYLEHFAH